MRNLVSSVYHKVLQSVTYSSEGGRTKSDWREDWRGRSSHEGRDVFVEKLAFTLNIEVGAELDQICLL